MQLTYFNITGYEDRQIPCLLHEPEDALEHLVVMVPGGGYPCDRPLFYYPTDMFLAKKMRVLHINNDNSRNEEFRAYWDRGEREKINAWREAEGKSIAAFIASKYRCPITLMGMSNGTRIMTHILDQAKAVQSIWLSASLNERWDYLSHNADDIVIMGSEDSCYERGKPYLPKQTLVIPGGNHSLELGDDVVASLDVLKSILLHIAGKILIKDNFTKRS
ncbi:MAG: hypothetical protein AB7T49_10485 [Oligoflexales bacterium]